MKLEKQMSWLNAFCNNQFPRFYLICCINKPSKRKHSKFHEKKIL